jgi:hypothetical protein
MATRSDAERAAQLEQVVALLRVLRDLAPKEVERRAHGDDFDLLRNIALNEPVVLTGLLDDSPALERWSPAYLRERFGDVVLDVSVGRASDDAPDRNFARLTRARPLREIVDLVESAGRSDDVYLIANQRALERDELQPLLDDVVMPGFCEPARAQGGTSLWFGPAGTYTRLHHDTTNIVFCQMYGKKRVWLVSPLEVAMLETADDFYNLRDPDAGDLDELPVRVVDLEPGEALLIPVGWWHWVRALSTSINLSFTNLRWRNRFDFYAPGCVGRSRKNATIE